jgi:predicted nucleotide-binding protein
MKAPKSACESLAASVRQAFSHLERTEKRLAKAERIGTNVFIGHGRSKEWKDLKEFINDRMRLPWDEFNRVPVAGIPNTVRLSTMLDAGAIAFLILTAEDEMADGKMQARMNVIHEAGLFQGRLGFSRAIVLLEEGCEEFSNIEGLGQIRFPKNNIRAAFHDVQLVLEREGVVEPPPA